MLPKKRSLGSIIRGGFNEHPSKVEAAMAE
jgi:hypothetical protein